jgi:hypothetical protein
MKAAAWWNSSDKHGPQPDTVALLKTFEQSLEIFQADLERLLEERDRE